MARQTTSTDNTSTESDGGIVLSDVDPPNESVPAEEPTVKRS